MTEAERFNEGKPPVGYILDFPRTIEAIARVMEHGATKYARDNWKQGGKPDAEYYDSGMRHMLKHKGGEMFDPDSGCTHLAHAIWNLMALYELNTLVPNKDKNENTSNSG